MSGIPEQLYHTTLTVVDYHTDTSGSTRTVYVLGTHTTLEAAKAFAKKALSDLGYEPSDFKEYAVRAASPDSWTHGDGVVAFAKAFAGQEFLVGIDTTPNDQEFAAGPNGTVRLSAYPEDAGVHPDHHLHYVLQTKVDYDQDRSGAHQSTDIEGCFEHRADAIDAAKASLLNTGNEFAQYDERDNPAFAGEWPFGEDVVIHAVSQTGENYTVAIRTIPGAHEKHGKKTQRK
ncbi:hypothetical protein CMQ_2358 [Grosmannia clavigera kw1407]|uniref:Uncharacterized protein n=1 Tax=Grosmannia clavigera (strain kw1407 / UAMH 11150) TaxID=655863 RepID=F0XJI8_GROCL|nr:uncharacterized protein CMQ_2358 [Grosmannia clavigera kw1407]EFX02309.1 hypothetical protein CMQ_2358 [Grosmannia clavigera kw1407]